MSFKLKQIEGILTGSDNGDITDESGSKITDESGNDVEAENYSLAYPSFNMFLVDKEGNRVTDPAGRKLITYDEKSV